MRPDRAVPQPRFAAVRARGRGGSPLVALILALGLVACGRPGLGSLTDTLGAAGAGGTTAALAAAPDFEFTTFEGRRLGLADLKGKAVVLNFWASWCAPCRAEMPYFESTSRAFRDRGVVFVGLATQDLDQDSRAFIAELGITYPTGPDQGGEIAQRYQVGGLPTTAFITRDGKLARKWLGALSEQQLLANLAEIAR